jgi:hypothetical protein
MFHPLESDLSQLKDKDIEDKLVDLNKKYYIAARSGNINLLTQVETFVTIYKNELSKRYRDKMKQQDDNDLDQLINVD